MAPSSRLVKATAEQERRPHISEVRSLFSRRYLKNQKCTLKHLVSLQMALLPEQRQMALLVHLSFSDSFRRTTPAM